MTVPARFRTARRLLAPRWLLEGEGGLVGYALDLVKDAFVDRAYLGLLARFPATAPSDALDALGRDRRVVRGINESAESYATRLLAWLDDRKTAGNPFALMQKLAEYTGSTGCSFRTVDAAGNWFSRAVDGTRTFVLNRANWDWDNTVPSTQWARFWVIIYPGTLWTQSPTVGAGPVLGASTATIGSSATPDQVATVRAIVADWKPEGTKCMNVILAFDPASFDPSSGVDSTGMPDGFWGQLSKNASDVQVPSRLTTACYWSGV